MKENCVPLGAAPLKQLVGWTWNRWRAWASKPQRGWGWNRVDLVQIHFGPPARNGDEYGRKMVFGLTCMGNGGKMAQKMGKWPEIWENGPQMANGSKMEFRAIFSHSPGHRWGQDPFLGHFRPPLGPHGSVRGPRDSKSEGIGHLFSVKKNAEFFAYS